LSLGKRTLKPHDNFTTHSPEWIKWERHIVPSAGKDAETGTLGTGEGDTGATAQLTHAWHHTRAYTLQRGVRPPKCTWCPRRHSACHWSYVPICPWITIHSGWKHGHSISKDVSNPHTLWIVEPSEEAKVI
jgi:hypothetical protein